MGEMERWRDGRMVEGERVEGGDGGMEGWKDGRMEGWRDGRMEGWKDGRMEGWRDGRIILISKSKGKKEKKCKKLSLDVVKTMCFTVFL